DGDGTCSSRCAYATLFRSEQLANASVGGDVYYDGATFTYVDVDGDTQTIDLEEQVPANETVTTLANNGNGIYTYTSEDGTETVMDVPAAVISKFEEVVNGGKVTNNGNTYHTNADYGEQEEYADTTVRASGGEGDPEVMNLEELVQANETVTTLMNNGDGTYTYTSEDGTETIVDVPASVISQFEEVVNGGPVKVNGNTYNTIEEYIEQQVAANETVTALANNGNGIYTYTSEDGTETVINVPADVISNFETIMGDENVLNELIEQLTNTSVGGNVYYDGTTFTY